MKICRYLEDGSRICGYHLDCSVCEKNKKNGVHNWITVTEQLPIDGDDILYCVIYIDCGTYYLMRGRSYFHNGEFNIPAEVVLWRPMEETEFEGM